MDVQNFSVISFAEEQVLFDTDKVVEKYKEELSGLDASKGDASEEIRKKEEITSEDCEFVIVPVSVNTETISTSSVYLKDIVPYVETPVMVKLLLDEAKIKFTYSSQTIIF